MPAGLVATEVSLATIGRAPFTAEELSPAEEALAEASASALAFSNMALCFSSSLARIGMRSGGMGFVSCQGVSIMAQCNLKGEETLNVWLNLTKSALRLSISFFASACFR